MIINKSGEVFFAKAILDRAILDSKDSRNYWDLYIFVHSNEFKMYCEFANYDKAKTRAKILKCKKGKKGVSPNYFTILFPQYKNSISNFFGAKKDYFTKRQCLEVSKAIIKREVSL